MQYKTLGKTGLQVSVIGYGGAVLGIPYYLAPEDPTHVERHSTYHEALTRAVTWGITYFDTAPGYGDGLSERIYGQVLPAYRNQIVLASKVTYAGSPEQIHLSVENSLRRLRVDCIDVMKFHGCYFSEAEADSILNGGRLERLEQLREQGKLRFIGVTAEVPTGALERMIRTGRFDVLQICYNLINQLACDHSRRCRGIVALAEEHGLGVVTMRSATSGFLQKLLLREFGGAMDERAITQMCLKYVLSTPEIDVALVGMRSPEEVEQNAVLAADLSARYDLKELHDRFFHP